MSYQLAPIGSGNKITQINVSTGATATTDLTDPAVNITSLMFYCDGTDPLSAGDYAQAHVTIVISGTVATGPGRTVPFNVETGATMRGSDL